MMSQVAQDGGRPWVSVVMSVYNGGRYLEAALRSARAQSVSDIEILVVDDRSSDDSLAIAHRHAADDARIRVFTLNTNLGPAGARNVALAVARGAWVAVFDCDDLMHPQRLERLLLHAEATGADIVADDVMIFADHANTPNAALLGKQNPGSIDLAAFIRANLLFGRGVALGYLKPLFRATFLARHALRYDETLRIAEDYDLVARALALGAAYHVSTSLTYFYRKHENSISHRIRRDDIVAMREAQARFEANFPTPSPDVRSALAGRRAAMDQAIAFSDIVMAIKQRRLGGCLAAIWRAPSAVWLLRLPLLARLGRMLPKRAAPKLAPPGAVMEFLLDAKPASDVEVDVCICTFRRSSLRETLLSISAQRLPPGVTMRLIVADNDETPSAKALVDQVARETGLRIHYIHAPARNISTARNACLDAACAPVMAFIDDDEIASASWLSDLLDSQRRSGADITFGPVKAIYPQKPGWLAQADLHSIGPARRADGVLDTGYTSNVLLNRQTLGARLQACRFDRELGRSGGEDSLFFHALHLAGAKMNFCAEAVVMEPVPDHRARLGWLLSRSFRSGQSHGRMLLQNRDGRIGLIAVALVKLAYCLAAACGQAVVPSGWRRYLVRGALHAGVVAKIAGVRDLQLY